MIQTEFLIGELKNEYWKTRVKAAVQLGEIGDPATVFPLIETLWDEERLVKESAIEALGKIGIPAVLPLFNMLVDYEKREISRELENVLVKVGKPAVQILVKLINKKNYESYATNIIKILEEIGDQEAVIPLINLLEDNSEIIRNCAIKALGKIGDKRAIQPILSTMKKRGYSPETIEALVDLGETTVIPLLITLLGGEKPWRVAELLGKMGREAVEYLSVSLNNKETTNSREFFVTALGYTGAKEAVNPLITALKAEDRIVSWRAASALVNIGELAVAPLIEMLNEKSQYIKMLAIDSLEKIGDMRAVKPLKRLVLNESSDEIKNLAIIALESIQSPKKPETSDIRIYIEKEIFVLRIGLSDRYFRASLINDKPYLSSKEINNLKRGNLILPVPVSYRYSGGETVPDDFIWTDNCFLISERTKKTFEDFNLTGWKTYPIKLYDKKGNLINGYYGFAITGKVGPVDYTRSKIIAKPSMVLGKPNIVKIGIYFDENSWDGSDFFIATPILVTNRVVEALKKARPKIKNWKHYPASEYEWPLIFDYYETNFLTEEERDIVNDLRKEFEKEHRQEMLRTKKILHHSEIENKCEFQHLLKSIVKNQCMFKTISEQDFCQSILKSLDESGQTGIVKMIDAMQDKDGEIRTGAAYVLGKLKIREAVNPLIQAIKDENENVRKEAVMALGRIGDSRAVVPLIKVLEGEDTINVRCAAAEALGVIGDPKAFQYLISALEAEEVFLQSDAVSALGKLGNPKAVLPLINLFINEDSNLAEHIKSALANIGQPAVLPLIQALRHEHPFVRRGAASNLGDMHEQKAVLPLIECLSLEDDPEVLSFVVEALGNIGDRRAVKPLLNIENTTTIGYLQEETKIALQKIKVTKT